MHAEEGEEKDSFWEGIGKICTIKSDIRISHLDSEGFHPTTEGSNWDSNSTRNGINYKPLDRFHRIQ